MDNHLRAPLEAVLNALVPLKVLGRGIAELDTRLARSITEAVQALNTALPLPSPDKAMDMAIKAAIEKGHLPDLHPDVTNFGREVIREYLAIQPEEPDDMACCIGCGTYPKGPYTCATCVAADEYEGPPEHVSDWPTRC